ncbi:MAG: hypothetical protein KBS59_00105, partial [Clostridiales bacterium]|nr:hypothetical protein [Clostridiales bacterium]
MAAKTSKTIKSNIKKYILFQALYSTAIVLTTGSVIQAFFVYLGLEDSASLYASVIQIIQVASMMLCSLWCDKIRSIIRAVGISVCVIGVISASLVFVCFGVPADTFAAYILIIAVSCISSVGLGIYNVLIYKLPYEIYDINEFGKYSAFCGIASGVCGFLCTSLISVLSGKFGYISVITAFFIIALALFAISAAVCFSLKKIPHSATSEKTKINLISYPVFTKLIPANILRGIGNGIIGLMTVIGTKDGILTEATAVHVATVSVLGSISGFLLYLLASKFMSVKTLTLLTSVFAVLGFPLTVFAQTQSMLYIMYYLSYACVVALGNCIPVLVYGGVPQSIIGKYTAWRMLLFTFGSAVPGFFMNALLDGIGAVAVM